MWPKSYRDYKTDEPLKKYRVESGRGIIGFEGHEINGWGNQRHVPKKKKKGFVSTLLGTLFGKISPSDEEK
jgi:hypothetical protein